jgi:hypothetical protein
VAKILALKQLQGTRKNQVLEERKLPIRKAAETLRVVSDRGSAQLLCVMKINDNIKEKKQV